MRSLVHSLDLECGALQLGGSALLSDRAAWHAGSAMKAALRKCKASTDIKRTIGAKLGASIRVWMELDPVLARMQLGLAVEAQVLHPAFHAGYPGISFAASVTDPVKPAMSSEPGDQHKASPSGSIPTSDLSRAGRGDTSPLSRVQSPAARSSLRNGSDFEEKQGPDVRRSR